MARGSLRIYLGAAPGVGKTYKMLGEGVRRAERGTDVVIGIVETHGASPDRRADRRPRGRCHAARSSTAAPCCTRWTSTPSLPGGPRSCSSTSTPTPTRPGRATRSGGRTSSSCSTPASTSSRRSTSSTSSRSTTSSPRITGITQRETVPDDIVRRADQLELVDMSPEAIRRRMAHGNIYPAERIDAALANYFRPGNLGALRELALLWVADRVEESLHGYLDAHGISDPWETRERVVVGITGVAGGEALIRRAARMAGRVGGDLIGVHVARRRRPAHARPATRSPRSASSSSELGGTVHEVVGHDAAEALAAFARRGEGDPARARREPAQPAGTSCVHGSFVARVTRSRADVDVHVIADRALAERHGRPHPASARARSTAGAPSSAWVLRGRRPALLIVRDSSAPRSTSTLSTDCCWSLVARAGDRGHRRHGRGGGRRGGRVAARQLVLRAALRHA